MPDVSARFPRPFTAARLILVSLVLLTACAPLGGIRASGFSLPSTTKGSIAFTPVDGASNLDPAKTEVVVRAVAAGARLKSVTLLPDSGDPVAAPVKNGQLDLKSGLKPDTHYVVSAVAAVRKQGATSDSDETQTSEFSTAITPKVVSTTPATIGQGQSVVLTLSPAASSVSIDGPVRGQLGPDGTTITVVPVDFQQGQTYSFSVIARSLKGVVGLPQTATFGTLGAATASAYPDDGSSNQGVGIPLTLTLSGAPADKAAIASHLSVNVTVNQPAAAPGTGLCAAYASPTVASGDLPVAVSWTTDRRVRLTPRTPDGDWPANSTVKLSASLNGLSTIAGNTFDHDITSTFTTGDKRVIDVDLTGQHLTACKNGTQVNDFLISSGTTTHATNVGGTYYIWLRKADEEMKSPEGPFAPDWYDIKHVPWTQYFDGSEALHGAWWHNNFGHPMSHGCVNVQTPTDNTKWPNAAPQAEWLWNFDNLGDPVVVHGVTPGLTAATQPTD
ncbi:MAG TPA: L,D-transpeptidase family protein [Candidatus Solibacter sp.]|jgi:lipoprotein-anchoring transpeptidase ErfK/SrfK|nr:L,D-transpeptidase family protein [Candidatus Solibacter sp.]